MIFATGYRYSFPFLSQYYDGATYVPHEGSASTVSPFLPLDGSHIRDLYLDHFYMQDPTLAFIGGLWPVLCVVFHLSFSHMQSPWAARGRSFFRITRRSRWLKSGQTRQSFRAVRRWGHCTRRVWRNVEDMARTSCSSVRNSFWASHLSLVPVLGLTSQS